LFAQCFARGGVFHPRSYCLLHAVGHRYDRVWQRGEAPSAAGSFLGVSIEGDTTMGGMCAPSWRWRAAILPLILLMLAQVSTISARAEEAAGKGRYVLDYPAADTFFLPVRSYAQDVVETVIETDGVLTQHMPNGGYGLSVVMKVEGQNLPATILHKIQNPNFAIIGYGLSIKGWRDPTEFLRDKNAGQPPVR
jgi:hypothetical protein